MISKLLVLCVNIVLICAAPLQPVVQQLQATHLTPLQQQLLALQQLEMLKRLTAVTAPAFPNPAPVLLLLPNFPAIQNINDIIKNPADLSAKEYLKLKTTNNEADDDESVVINAEDISIDPGRITDRAVLLLPNRARLSLGDIISSIPWLPIEVNVPDTISWIYNGIAGIIAGIGQRFPFKRPQNGLMTPQDNVRLLLKQHQLQQQQVMNVLPILLIPIDAPIVGS